MQYENRQLDLLFNILYLRYIAFIVYYSIENNSIVLLLVVKNYPSKPYQKNYFVIVNIAKMAFVQLWWEIVTFF